MHDKPEGGLSWMARLERIEAHAVAGARADGNVDKSDWIRMWAEARQAQEKPYDSDDWKEAFNGE